MNLPNFHDIKLFKTQRRFMQALQNPAVTVIAFGGAKKGGKALALHTPIPTPSGWTCMGDIKSGDYVFDEYGYPCKVTATTEVMYGRKVYAITFDDGEVIIADGQHEWLTETLAARQSAQRFSQKEPAKNPQLARPQRRVTPSVVTTEEIRCTLTTRADQCSNHVVRNAAPLQCYEQQLPVEPYVLGVWLGDGTTGYSSFASADEQIVDEIKAHGYLVVKQPSNKYMYSIRGLIYGLRRIGVANDKHIPVEYLRSSEQQRWALLQGLMDTDGTALPNGACEFYSTSERLIGDFRELIVSLGLKGRICTGRAILNGKDCGPKYRVKFTTDRPVFRLDRKLSKQKKRVCGRTSHRTIVSVEPVPSEPVRCIEVDSASHLYLAGRSMIPTHNSFISRFAILLRRLMYPGTNGVITRRSYGDVIKNHKSQIQALCRKYKIKYRWDSDQYFFEFPEYTHDGVTSKLYLGYADSVRDAERYQGIEFMDIFHEEAAQHEWIVLAAINTELVAPSHVSGVTPKIIYTWNPIGVGKAAIRENVKNPALIGKPGYVFIASNWEDNIPFKRANPNFADNIREQYKHEPWMVSALLEGDDSSDPDKFFVFDRDSTYNVRRILIPHWAKHYAGVDHGYWPSAFGAVYAARWTDHSPTGGLDHLHFFAEKKIWRKEPDECARECKEYEKQIRFPAPPYSIRYGDWSIDAHKEQPSYEATRTVATMWESEGWYVQAAERKAKSSGLIVMRKLLKSGVMTIDPSCRALIGEIDAAQYEKYANGQIGTCTDPKQPDDMMDAARNIVTEVYGIDYQDAPTSEWERLKEEYEEFAA